MQEEKNGKLNGEVFPEVKVTEDRKRHFFSINKDALPYTLHFFLFVSAMGAVLPYLSAFGINQLGITASNIAVAYTTQQFLIIFFKPGIGYLADYFNKLKATIIGLTIFQAIIIFLMLNIPKLDVQSISDGFEPQISTSSTGFMNCELCSSYLEFKTISLNLPVKSSVGQDGVNCLKYSQNDVEKALIQCDSQDANSSEHNNVKYDIIYKECDNVFVHNNLNFTKKPIHSNLTESKLFLITVVQPKSETSNILCIQPVQKDFNFVELHITKALITEYCYSVQESESELLRASFTNNVTSSQNFSCGYNQQHYIPISEGARSALLSRKIFKTYQFWLYTICLITCCCSISSIFTMSDTAVHESVQKTGIDFGKSRCWGAVGWGIVAPLAGYLNDYTESYMASWCVMVVFCVLQIWNLSKMNLEKPDFSKSIFKDMKTVFSSLEFVAFEIGVFMNGVFTGAIWFYLTWFLMSIGGNKFIIGLAHTVQCFFGELPFMVISTWMIKKLGHFNIVSLALFAHAVRFFIYSYLHNPLWILPVESLHGFTFGSFYAALTSYAKLNAKPGTEATTQSILCTTYEALGAGAGCVLFGFCFDKFGGHTTFFYSTYLGAFAMSINVLFTIILKCRKRAIQVSLPDP